MNTMRDSLASSQSHTKEYLENEKVQIAIRIVIMLLVGSLAPFMGLERIKLFSWELSIYSMIVIVFTANLLYLLFILKYPFVWQKQRILLFAFFDVVSSMLVMAYAGRVGGYFAGIFLWYIIGYSMRYDRSVAFTVYISLLFSWMVMIGVVPYWREHHEVALGWLATYAVIPLYFFKLSEKLKRTIE